jgi:hypothetical protein
MPLTDTILDEAYFIFEEFGPNRTFNRRDRLRGVFRDLSEAELDTLMEKMSQVSKTVWKLAEQGGEMKLGKEKVKELLTREHPFLRGKGLDRAAMMVNYFAWHEGYDK